MTIEYGTGSEVSTEDANGRMTRAALQGGDHGGVVAAFIGD